ncbi:hypothetical protein DYB34_004460, partial [Aphanomyces astaci]
MAETQNIVCIVLFTRSEAPFHREKDGRGRMLRLRGMRNSQDANPSKPPLTKNDENDENAGQGGRRSARHKVKRLPLGTLPGPNATSNDKSTLKSKKRPLEDYNKGPTRRKRVDHDILTDEVRIRCQTTRAKPCRKVYHPHEHASKSQVSRRNTVGIAYPTVRNDATPAASMSSRDASMAAVPGGARHSHTTETDGIVTPIPLAPPAMESMQDGTMASLFSTGRGASLRVSAAKTKSYEALLSSDALDTGAVQPAPIAATPALGVEVTGSINPRPTALPPPSVMVSLFQTARGTQVNVSSAKVREYAAKLQESPVREEDHGVQATVDSRTVPGTISLLDKASASTFDSRQPERSGTMSRTSPHDQDSTVSMFQSAKRGRPLHVSAAKAAMYAQTQLCSHKELQHLPGIPPLKNKVEALSTPQLSMSQQHGQDSDRVPHDDDSKLRNNLQATAHATELAESVDGPFSVVSLFTSGRGRPVEICVDKIQAYERQLFADDDDEPAPPTIEEVEACSNTPSSNITMVRNSSPLANNSKHHDHGSSMHTTRQEDDHKSPATAFVPHVTSLNSDLTNILMADKGDACKERAVARGCTSRAPVDVRGTSINDDDTSTGCGETATLGNMQRSCTINGSPQQHAPERNHLAQCQRGQDDEDGVHPNGHQDASCTGIDATSCFETAAGRQVTVSMDDAALELLSDPMVDHNMQNTDVHAHLSKLQPAVPALPQLPIDTLASPISTHMSSVPCAANHPRSRLHEYSARELKPSRASTSTRRQPHRTSAFQAPRKLANPIAKTHSDPGRALAPPRRPVVVAASAVPFPVSVSESWKFPQLAKCPRAFSPYPFESATTIHAISAENAHTVRFNHVGRPELLHCADDDGGMTWSAGDLYEYMVAQRHMVPSLGASRAWFVNHFRWIVLKCAAMERTFAAQLFG